MRDTTSRAFDGVHEREGDFLEADGVELRKQAVPEHFGRDAGAVGDEEGGARRRHGWYYPISVSGGRP